MIGRSKCSVSDQLLYVPERIEELDTLKTPIELDGRIYNDYLKFFTGMIYRIG